MSLYHGHTHVVYLIYNLHILIFQAASLTCRHEPEQAKCDQEPVNIM